VKYGWGGHGASVPNERRTQLYLGVQDLVFGGLAAAAMLESKGHDAGTIARTRVDIRSVGEEEVCSNTITCFDSNM
jgi:hypothetical protein